MSSSANRELWEAALNGGTFEQSQAALDEVVSLLEDGNLPLAESIECFALGMRLADRCEKMLAEAELVVTTLAAQEIESAFGADVLTGGHNGLAIEDEIPF